jgi:GT2 family glycosyltransferase
MVSVVALVIPAETPFCSVCIANYNGEQLLVDCIESILNQHFDRGIEIIVHDDASSDASITLLQQRYPDVVVIETTANVGFCVANNRMAEHARGQYLLLLNNDAALMSGALATLAEHAALQSPPGILSLPQYDWDGGDLVDRGCLLDPFYNPVPNLDPRRRDVAMVIGACLWLPRSLWQELGGFPAWFGSIAEDMFLCCNARLRGYPVQVPDASGYRHRQGKSFGGNRVADRRLASTFRRRSLSERNKTYTMIACTPAALLLLLLPLHLALLVAEGALLSLLRRDARIWRDIYAPVLPAAIRQRGEIGAARKSSFASPPAARVRYLRQFTPWPRKLALLVGYGLPSIR